MKKYEFINIYIYENMKLTTYKIRRKCFTAMLYFGFYAYTKVLYKCFFKNLF